mgnify:CR=1 FL=1
MKRFISLAAAAAMIFGAASCQKELATQKGDCKVSFSVSIPQEDETKASQEDETKPYKISEGNRINFLRYQIYEKDSQIIAHEGYEYYDEGTTHFELEFALVSGMTYEALFWAGNKSVLGYDVRNLKDVTISPYNHSNTFAYYPANDECRDAFCGSTVVKVEHMATNNEVTLTRPFAQVNFGSSPIDWARAEKFVSTGSEQLGLVSRVVFSNLASKYNVLTREASGTNPNVVYDYAQAPVVNPEVSYWSTYIHFQGQNYKRIAMCYVLPQSNPDNISSVTGYFKHNLIMDDDTKALRKEVVNVPVKQNYRTNILGEFFTGGNKFIIDINSKFVNQDSQDSEKYPEYDVVSPLEFAMINGGTFTLAKDAVIEASYVVNGKKTTINLNGHKLTYTGGDIFARVQSKGQLTITGEGTFEANGYIASANAGGNIVVENGVFVTSDATLFQTNGGELTINGGSFTAEPYQDTYFTLNKVDNTDGKITVNAGRFYKFNPAESNTEPGGPVSFVSASSTVSPDGDWFVVSSNNN